MKTITAKTLELAIDQASEELGVVKEELLYEVLEEKKGLFSKKVVVAFYDTADVIEFAQKYISNIIHEGLGLDVSLKAFYRNGLIKILIETDHNSLLIGRNGQTLQALNELVKLAISSKFKRKFRILLDIGDYKDKKYNRVIAVAKRAASQVLKTHLDIKLEAMTPDERKKVHTALASWKNIKTESVGDGKDRAIVVKYVGTNTPNINIPPQKETQVEGQVEGE